MKLPAALASALIAVFGFAAATVHAEDAGRTVRIDNGYMVKTLTVNNADLKTEQGAGKIYDRLVEVATEVCDANGDAPAWVLDQDRDCVDSAVVRAVADLRSEPLRQVLMARSDEGRRAQSYARGDR